MKSLRAVATLVAALLATGMAHALRVGEPAPPFSATDVNGRALSLADFRGRTVVLEWVNPGCPFVRKHYGSGNMQGTQKQAMAQGVVWLAINSTAAGHVDYRAPAAMAAWMQAQHAAATATLMDTEGQIGRTYGARTTPEMYVIDPSGTLVYAGAIDDRPSADPADIARATNYVKQALAELHAGRAVSVPQSRPYGCSIKYAAGA
jgi:hypothetical protein